MIWSSASTRTSCSALITIRYVQLAIVSPPGSFLFFFFWNIDPISLWLNSWRDCIGALHFSDCRRRRSSRKLRVSWPSSSPIRNPANRPKRKRPSQVSHFVYVFFLSFILLSGTKQKMFSGGRGPDAIIPSCRHANVVFLSRARSFLSLSVHLSLAFLSLSSPLSHQR